MTFIRFSNSSALAPFVGRIVEELDDLPAQPLVARFVEELAVPVLLDVEAADIERWYGQRELLRREPREVQRERVRHRRHQVGARNDDRDAQEMRRVQRDFAPDLLALEQLLEQL